MLNISLQSLHSFFVLCITKAYQILIRYSGKKPRLKFWNNCDSCYAKYFLICNPFISYANFCFVSESLHYATAKYFNTIASMEKVYIKECERRPVVDPAICEMELNEPELQMPEPKIKVAFVLTFSAYFVYFSLCRIVAVWFSFFVFFFSSIFIGFSILLFVVLCINQVWEMNSCVTLATAAVRGPIWISLESTMSGWVVR